MKKIILLIMLVAFSAAGFAQVERSATIRTGFSTMSRPIKLSVADSIVTSDSLIITISNPQKYLQYQTFTTTLTDVDGGSPSVLISVWGKVTSADTWHPIGTPVTWTTTGNNPTTMTGATPHNYNYFRVSYVASAAAQHLSVATFVVQTSNASEVTSSGTVTFSRATTGTVTLTSADNDGNAALTLEAGGTGALTLGDVGSTTAITSSNWKIGATGIATGLGDVTSNGDFVTTGKIAAADSLCVDSFRFIERLDTLCSITGTDTLRIHPAR